MITQWERHTFRNDSHLQLCRERSRPVVAGELLADAQIDPEHPLEAGGLPERRFNVAGATDKPRRRLPPRLLRAIKSSQAAYGDAYNEIKKHEDFGRMIETAKSLA